MFASKKRFIHSSTQKFKVRSRILFFACEYSYLISGANNRKCDFFNSLFILLVLKAFACQRHLLLLAFYIIKKRRSRLWCVLVFTMMMMFDGADSWIWVKSSCCSWSDIGEFCAIHLIKLVTFGVRCLWVSFM
jgi:hypothetical protein